MTLVAFKKSPFLFLSILLTHLSRDEKNQGQNRKKKKKDKNKIQWDYIFIQALPKVHWECSTFWYLFYCSVEFLRFLGFLLSLAEIGVLSSARAEDVQKPAHQNN